MRYILEKYFHILDLEEYLRDVIEFDFVLNVKRLIVYIFLSFTSLSFRYLGISHTCVASICYFKKMFTIKYNSNKAQ